MFGVEQPEGKDVTLTKQAFRQRYGADPLAVAFAPGRVNLIGEHIDYVGGSVLPCAIQYGVCVAAEAVAADPAGAAELEPPPWFPPFEISLAPASPVQPDAAQWVTAQRLVEELLWRLEPHLLGSAAADNTPGLPLGTVLRFCVFSNLPLGAGLASSAAFCVAVAAATLGVCRSAMQAVALCELCQAAEQAATGVQCGLMDQFACVFGEQGQALHFDPQTKSHQSVRCFLYPCELVVIDSGQSRALTDTAYNQRRAELETALRTFTGDPRELADLTSPGVRRLNHLIHEQARVFAMRQGLGLGLPTRAHVGELLNRSQASLRDLYEVSTPQLDLLCELLCQATLPTGDPLALGARLVGAGFGGSVLALLDRKALQSDDAGRCPVDVVLADYAQRTGLTPHLLPVRPSHGAVVYALSGPAIRGPRQTGTLLSQWQWYE